jgi:hypothetical protein
VPPFAQELLQRQLVLVLELESFELEEPLLPERELERLLAVALMLRLALGESRVLVRKN